MNWQAELLSSEYLLFVEIKLKTDNLQRALVLEIKIQSELMLNLSKK